MHTNTDPWTQDVPTYTVAQPVVPLGKRLGRFVTLIGAIFAVTAAVIITQQLSRDSLALLVGLTCGVMAMLPTLALGFLVWRREDARHQEQTQLRTQQQHVRPYATPPVIVVSPQALPGTMNGHPALQPSGQPWPWAPSQSQRSFTIVGGEE
jgi:hypothetical protein